MGVVVSDKRYVTYRREEDFVFDKQYLSTDIRNGFTGKPLNGWWGSPVDAYYGWKEWCFDNDYELDTYQFDKPIYWHLQEGSKVLTISHTEAYEFNQSNALLPYIDIKGIDNTNDITSKIKAITNSKEYGIGTYDSIKINFTRIKEDGIAGVELLDACIGHFFDNPVETMFNSWDCESIVILDKDTIVIESE